MSCKATVVAPSNIAFLKYWGALDLDSALPLNVSLSMTLSRCVTRTTVEPLSGEGAHRIEVVGAEGRLEPAAPRFAAGIEAHLGRLGEVLEAPGTFRVATANTFPSSAGIASSASGFAALAAAFAAAAGREVSPEQLSILARRSGSGSAARSALGGYVEWPATGEARGAAGEDGREEAGSVGPPALEDAAAPARQLAPPEHWELCDLIAVVGSEPKGVSSRQGHARAGSSPHFARRLGLVGQRLATMRQAVLERDLTALGAALEIEAVELHLIAMSSAPPIFYWLPATLEVLARARALRDEGVEVWATMDAGPNVHLICEPASEAAVAEAIGGIAGVERLIHDRVGCGPRASDEHLF